MEARFDWPAIGVAVGLIVGITSVFAIAVPVAGALLVNEQFGPTDWNTLTISGSVFYRFFFWAISWGLTVWQGAVIMRKVKHDRIIDDMLVTAVASAILLTFIVKVIVWIAFQPINPDNSPQFFITSIDAGGALLLIVVALIGARANVA